MAHSTFTYIGISTRGLNPPAPALIYAIDENGRVCAIFPSGDKALLKGKDGCPAKREEIAALPNYIAYREGEIFTHERKHCVFLFHLDDLFTGSTRRLKTRLARKIRSLRALQERTGEQEEKLERFEKVLSFVDRAL